MIFQSFSSSYSYINDGENETIEEHKEIINNKNRVAIGKQEKKKKKNVIKRNFYKTKNEKSLYGTSINKDTYKIQERINNDKYDEYMSNNKYNELFEIEDIKKEKRGTKNKLILWNLRSIFNVFSEPFFNI